MPVRVLMRKRFTIILLLLFVSATGYGQLSFDHITVAQGLSQSTVLSICKDSRGYMWFATRDRLNRYDGRTVYIYQHDKNPASISCSDYTYFVTEDHTENIWVGTVKGLNRFIPASNGFERILHNASDKTSISDNNVFCGYQDSKGHLWFGTINGLNMLPDAASRTFTRFYKAQPGRPGLAGNQVNAIYEDGQHRLWVGTTEGLTVMTPDGSNGYSFTSYTDTGNAAGLSGNSVKTITEDNRHRVWVGTETGGLQCFQPQTGTFIHFRYDAFNSNSISSNDVRKIIADKSGMLWIGTMTGLNLFDPETGTFTRYTHDVENRNSLNDNSIKEIYRDNNGSVWIGTMFGGVNVTHMNNIPFRVYQHNNFTNSISSNIVSAITETDNRYLWIGTEGNGLNCLDRNTGIFRSYTHSAADNSSIATNSVKAIYRDKNNTLWLGLHQGGMEMFDKATGRFTHFRHKEADKGSVSSDVVSCLLEDSRNRFWVGTSRGLQLFNRQQKTFRRYLTDTTQPLRLSSDGIRCLFEDHNHNIWAGTTGGLNLLGSGSTRFTWFAASDSDEKSLRAGYINCITEDSSGTVWIGAFHGGLSRYNAATRTFTSYTMQEGMPSDNVLAIQQENAQTLWISTDNGLVKFNTVTGKLKVFTVKDGLPGNECNYNSSWKDETGNLYFGTYNGLVSFQPSQLKENTFAPPVVFTGLQLFNQPVAIGDKSRLLAQDISVTDGITFTHDQNAFSISFAALNFNKPDRNRYRYRLDGFDADWNYVSIPAASYTNLPPGRYTLLVSGSNNDGIWGQQKAMSVTVLPAWYNTWWAWLFYSSILLTVLYYAAGFYRRQIRLKREKELYAMKLDFFTHASHEIRTPLTLITAPVEKLVKMAEGDAAMSRQLAYIQQNTGRLLRLVNELLDFRRMESGLGRLHAAEQDIVSFCRNVYGFFESVSVTRHITYTFTASREPVMVWFDAPQLEKVLFNILSNAFKFTPDGAVITVAADKQEDKVRIVVTDNGRGIPADVLPGIFDPFFRQSDDVQGWGVGLAVARHVMELHKGTITAESTEAVPGSEGHTVFTLLLPLGRAHLAESDIAETTAVETAQEAAYLMPAVTQPAAEAPEKPVLLIIEDNEEIRGFVAESLQQDYDILQCSNGKEGLDKACEVVPDIIICDVAMPVMDGLAFCTALKTDERISHIPVVLLTAKAAQMHLVSGLQTGADAYITKPFSMQVLQLQLHNLLQARLTMRQKYSRQVTLMPENKLLESPDEQFLNRLMATIEEHMDDPAFDVGKLVREMGMSQTVLYRKIKALTGVTITEFIKNHRLKKAALLLAQQKLTIAEVAYAVGFNDRKYFSREFKKQFGQAPSDYVAGSEPE